MADIGTIDIKVPKEQTLDVKKTDAFVRNSLGPFGLGVLVFKEVSITVARTNVPKNSLGFPQHNVKVPTTETVVGPRVDSLRTALGFLPKFLGILTRIEGTSNLPISKQALGIVGSPMNPPISLTSITGIVKEDGSPAAKRVRLYDRASGRLLSETTSNATTGVYLFDDVSTNNDYYVVAIDENGSPLKNAVVVDFIHK